MNAGGSRGSSRGSMTIHDHRGWFIHDVYTTYNGDDVYIILFIPPTSTYNGEAWWGLVIFGDIWWLGLPDYSPSYGWGPTNGQRKALDGRGPGALNAVESERNRYHRQKPEDLTWYVNIYIYILIYIYIYINIYIYIYDDSDHYHPHHEKNDHQISLNHPNISKYHQWQNVSLQASARPWAMEAFSTSWQGLVRMWASRCRCLNRLVFDAQNMKPAAGSSCGCPNYWVMFIWVWINTY